MRTVREINEDSQNSTREFSPEQNTAYVQLPLILEVLLDIRDLLSKEPNNNKK